jgi:CheY-like chemotaxis protein
MESSTSNVVLVIDDDEAIQTLMRVLLERMGFRVDIAGDGKAALQKLSEFRYSAILLDLMMPKVNGFEVVRHLRALQPEVLRRVVIFTAASEVTLKDFDARLVHRVIRKPFDIQTVVNAVSECARASWVSSPPASPEPLLAPAVRTGH